MVSYLICESCLLDKKKRPYEGSIKFMKYLDRLSIPYVIITNQSLKSRSYLCDYYKKKGYTMLLPQHFYTTTMSGVDLVDTHYPKKKTASYIGTSAMKETLQEGGFCVNLEHADFVFIGSDYQAAFNDYSYMHSLIKDGAIMFCTKDALVENLDGREVIGPLAIVKMLEASTNTKAYSLDFPVVNIINQALIYMHADRDGAILIGSNLEKEIRCGNNAGIQTVLLTPAMDESMNALLADVKPDYAVESLLGLLQ